MPLDLSRARLEAGLSLEEIAGHAEVAVSDLEAWEREGRVPRRHAVRVRWALWAAGRDAILRQSGLPECGRLLDLQATEPFADPRRVTAHVKDCEVCRARERLVSERLGPMPRRERGLLMAGAYLVSRLDGWRQAAAAGSLFMLTVGWIGVVVVLGLAVVRLEPRYVLGAVGLLLLIVSSGAAAGLFYHLTRPLRSTGAPGHYAGALLTVLGFFLSVYGLVDLAALLVGWDAATRNVRDMVTTPTGWAVTFSLTLVFGLVLGRTLRGL